MQSSAVSLIFVILFAQNRNTTAVMDKIMNAMARATTVPFRSPIALERKINYRRMRLTSERERFSVMFDTAGCSPFVDKSD